MPDCRTSSPGRSRPAWAWSSPAPRPAGSSPKPRLRGPAVGGSRPAETDRQTVRQTTLGTRAAPGLRHVPGRWSLSQAGHMGDSESCSLSSGWESEGSSNHAPNEVTGIPPTAAARAPHSGIRKPPGSRSAVCSGLWAWSGQPAGQRRCTVFCSTSRKMWQSGGEMSAAHSPTRVTPQGARRCSQPWFQRRVCGAGYAALSHDARTGLQLGVPVLMTGLSLSRVPGGCQAGVSVAQWRLTWRGVGRQGGLRCIFRAGWAGVWGLHC